MRFNFTLYCPMEVQDVVVYRSSNGKFKLSPLGSQVLSKPYLRFATPEKLAEDCTICFDSLVSKEEDSTQLSFLRCGHFMHLSCFKKYIEYIEMFSYTGDIRCHLCRSSLNKRAIEYIIEAIAAENEEDAIWALRSINANVEIQSLELITQDQCISCVSWVKSSNKELARAFLQILGIMIKKFYRKTRPDEYLSLENNPLYHILLLISPFDVLKIVEYEVKNNLDLSIKVLYQVLWCFYDQDDPFLLLKGSTEKDLVEANTNRKNLRYITKKVSRLLKEYFKDKTCSEETSHLCREWDEYISYRDAIERYQKCDLKYFLQTRLFIKISERLSDGIIPDRKDIDLFKSIFVDFKKKPDYITYHLLFSKTDHYGDTFFQQVFNTEIRPARDSPLFTDWSYFVKSFLQVFKNIIGGGRIDGAPSSLSYSLEIDYFHCFTALPATCFSFINWWLKTLKKSDHKATYKKYKIVDIKARISDLFSKIEDPALDESKRELLKTAVLREVDEYYLRWNHREIMRRFHRSYEAHDAFEDGY